MIALKILQSLLGLVFAFYVFKALLGKMGERDWTIAFAVMMAVFVVAFVRSRYFFGG
ncbi:MAG: hypothetical protein KJ634_11795 [Gammaproteobacteria bacterium]|nr:hypothetical protein [Gammaproteobacteria bacterium]MBU1416298.1 hypothetical protein [Gammaproteobacteria bacterium]